MKMISNTKRMSMNGTILGSELGCMPLPLPPPESLAPMVHHSLQVQNLAEADLGGIKIQHDCTSLT
jgi:hypothetical protein